VARVPRDEVEPGRGVVRNLPQRAAARADRPGDIQRGDEQRRPNRRRNACSRAGEQPRAPGPAERVDEEERDRAEGEVQVGERNRRDRRAGQDEPPAATAPRALEGPERERDQDRDRPAQVPCALRHAIGRQREGEPAEERRAARQAELAQPHAREASGREVGQQDQDVPGDDRPERLSQRPERQPERPAAEVDPRARLRPEGVRVEPGRAAVVELVPDEPEVVDGLQVVARGRFAADRLCARGEVRAEVLRRGPHRGQARRKVERAGESYKARAAESSSSKSGTSAVS
jgi:hypothetical protein